MEVKGQNIIMTAKYYHINTEIASYIELFVVNDLS